MFRSGASRRICAPKDAKISVKAAYPRSICSGWVMTLVPDAASAASTSRAPAKQTRPPAKIPNARDFSSPPLIAIHPLLYPPPARRRVLPAQTRTFAGSRAQKLIRCDAFFSFPAGPGEKMEGGQKIWNAHAGGGARGKRNAGGREIGTGIIFAASRKWWKELARRKLLGRTDGLHAGGGVTPGW